MSAKKVRNHIRQQRKERRRAIRAQERTATLKAKQEASAARAELKAEQEEERRQAAEEKQRRQQKDAGRTDSAKSPGESSAKGREKISAEGAETGADAGAPKRSHAAKHARASAGGASAAGARADGAPEGADSGTGAAARRGGGRRLAAVVVTAGILAVGGGSLAYDLGGTSAPLGHLGAAEVPAPGTGARLVCPPMPGQPDSLTGDGLLDYADRDDSASSTFSSLLFGTHRGGEIPGAATAPLTEDGRGEESTVTEDPEETADEAFEEAVSAEEEPLGERPVQRTTVTDLTAPTLLEVAAPAGGGPLAAGAFYDYHADSGPVAGLAAAGCTPPQRSQWFFGPELGGGATSLLTLANPSGRDATVEVASYGTDGARPGSGTRSLVVPAQSVRSLNVAAIAGGSDELGLRVEASGAPVAAQLQSSRAAGMTGQGVEFLPGQAEPGGEHHLPAVPMPDEEGTPAELWIHAPGEGQATVELQVFGPEGQVALENPSVFTVEGGEIDTLSLEGMDSGIYDVVVRADSPVHAAVRTEREEQDSEPETDPAVPEEPADPVADFSWAAPAPPLMPGSGTLLPATGETALRLTAPETGSTVTYRLLGEDSGFSEPQEVEIAAEESVTLGADDLEDAVAVVVDDVGEADAGVYAALLTEDDAGRFSITAVGELLDSSHTVPVLLRD